MFASFAISGMVFQNGAAMNSTGTEPIPRSAHYLSMIQEKLKALNLELPPIAPPGGSYASVNVRGNVAYVAIQFPILGEEYKYLGRYGWELSTDDGYEAAQLTGLNILAQIDHYVGFEKLEGLNHIDAYYQSAIGWDEAPKVVNGASDLFVNVLGERGKHARGIMGVDNLPRNFSIGIVSSFTIKP